MNNEKLEALIRAVESYMTFIYRHAIFNANAIESYVIEAERLMAAIEEARR